MNQVVSILINNYNYGRYLRQAIDSALSQTYPQCEVIVVDDASTDNSAEIIRSYGARIQAVLKEKNGGQASAFNAGFARSRGDIVMFLDSDDYLKPTAAERIVSVWGDEVMLLHHRLVVVDGEGKELGQIPNKECPLDSGNVVPLLLRQGYYSHPTTSGLAYGRSLLEKLLPMPEEDFRISADTWLFCKGPFLAPVTALDENLAFYRVHNANAVGTGLPRRLTSRRTLEAFVRGWDVRYALIRQQAAEKGMPIPDALKWETSISLRSRLILARLGLAPVGSPKKGVLVGQLMQKISAEPYPFLGALQQRVLTLLIWLAPRFVLRPLFPNIFGR